MRRSGITTRKVDVAIQDFFTKGIAFLYEGRNNSKQRHQECMDLFNKRMESEHRNAKYDYKYGEFEGVWCFKIEKHDL